jgi:two-component system NarL family sensor kinase
LQLLHIISDQIGLAIQRARLSAAQTRSAARLATIEERNRLAREIHDTIAQGLAAIILQLETADALGQDQPQRARDAVQRALRLARGNLEEARRSVMDLRAAPLQGYTLPEALALLARDEHVRSAASHARGEHEDEAEVRYSGPAEISALPARVEIGLYRIAQEALTNARKHAAAQHIELALAVDEQQVYLDVQDDGRGFDPEMMEQNVSTGHFGLAGIAERVKLLGGWMCIQSEPGTGTSISVSIPY